VDASATHLPPVPEASFRGILVDLDRDGDQDLLVRTPWRPPLVALRNDLGRGRTVVVSLRGTRSNRFGVGARVTASCGGRRQSQELLCGSGYLSGPPLELVFGLGAAEAIDRIDVAWSAGGTDAAENVRPGRVTIEEGKGVTARVAHVRAAPPAVSAPERVLR
jgi:hypothetical protein